MSRRNDGRDPVRDAITTSIAASPLHHARLCEILCSSARQPGQVVHAPGLTAFLDSLECDATRQQLLNTAPPAQVAVRFGCVSGSSSKAEMDRSASEPHAAQTEHHNEGAQLTSEVKQPAAGSGTPIPYLHWMAQVGSEDRVTALLRHGCDANLRDHRGWTALHYVCASGHLPIARVLGHHGARADVADTEGRLPCDVLVDLKTVTRRHDVMVLRDLLQNWPRLQQSGSTANHLFLCSVAVLLMPAVVLIFEHCPFLVAVVLLSALQFFLLQQCTPRFPGRGESNYFYVCFFWSCYLLSGVVYFTRCQFPEHHPQLHLLFFVVNVPFLLWFVRMIFFAPAECAPISLIASHGSACSLLLCFRCDQIRVPRAKHCRGCDRCIAVFDHYCWWLNRCVGKGNHRGFLALLMMIMVLHTYFVCILIFELSLDYQSLLTSWQMHSTYWLLMFLHGINALFECSILYKTFKVILFDVTISEQARRCTRTTDRSPWINVWRYLRYGLGR